MSDGYDPALLERAERLGAETGREHAQAEKERDRAERERAREEARKRAEVEKLIEKERERAEKAAEHNSLLEKSRIVRAYFDSDVFGPVLSAHGIKRPSSRASAEELDQLLAEIRGLVSASRARKTVDGILSAGVLFADKVWGDGRRFNFVKEDGTPIVNLTGMSDVWEKGRFSPYMNTAAEQVAIEYGGILGGGPLANLVFAFAQCCFMMHTVNEMKAGRYRLPVVTPVEEEGENS